MGNKLDEFVAEIYKIYTKSYTKGRIEAITVAINNNLVISEEDIIINI